MHSKYDVINYIENHKFNNSYYLNNQLLFNRLLACVSKFNWRNVLNDKINCKEHELYEWINQLIILPNNSLSTKINWILMDIHEYPLCQVCNTPLKNNISSIAFYPKCCSSNCSNKNPIKKLKIQQSLIDHFGVPVPMKSDIVKQHYSNTIKEMYGCDWYVQTNDFKHKFEQSCIDHFGVDHNMKSKDFYDLKYRKHFEDIGLWFPRDQKSDYEIYYELSDWKQQMFNYIDDPIQLNMLKTLGVFNSKTNVNGIVRDHIFSRAIGFTFKVFPEILRHPCNCQLISHRLNTIKRKKCGITLNELFIKILNFDKKWNEQSICVEQIINYQQGKRWINPYKVQ